MQEPKILLQIIATYLNQTVEEMLLGTRGNTVYGRHLFSYLAYEYELGNLNELSVFIKRDHIAVHNGKKRIKEWIQNDKKVQKDVIAIRHLYLYNNHTVLLKYLLGRTPTHALPLLVRKMQDWVKEIEINGFEVVEPEEL
ncbi:hypothetical protein [Maribacter sp.]|uniref:hypothetical protein n=1 Tax=Maribacter sp. TaxID=1897614 RepID=UPI0025C065B2|nr:hypothetical protein [Maribacter sp.]